MPPKKKDSEEGFGSNLHFQTSHVIYNIYTYLKKRKLDPSTYEHQNDINLVNTISEMTGLSKGCVNRTIRRGNDMKLGSGKICFRPREEKKQVGKKRIEVDKRTEGIIRRKVIQYYKTTNEVPSIRKLNAILKTDKILECSNEYLRQLLHKLGFTNNEKHTEALTEREELVSRRLNYLEVMKMYRLENKSIFFFNDTSCWEDLDDVELKDLPLCIIVHFSGTIGFRDSRIMMMKNRTDEQDENLKQSELYNWVKDSVLPNMPEESVVVLNTPSTDHEIKEKLSMASTRGDMQTWLARNFIPFKETDTKEKLYEKIVDHRERMQHSIEKLLKQYNHKIVYLPGNVPDLNPTLLAWESMSKNKDDQTPAKNLFSEFSNEHWQKYFTEVKENEREYYWHDMKMDGPPDDFATEIKSEIVDVKIEVDIDGFETNETSYNGMEYDY